MLLLVAGRWLVGWVFPAKDLEILDDPIPERLYCGRHCTPDKINCSGCCNSDNNNEGDNSSDVEKGLVMRDDIDGVNSTDRHPADINMTREMNNCDLWKHMVGTMDKEPVVANGRSSNGRGSLVANSSRASLVARANLISKFEEAENTEIATNTPSNIELSSSLFKSTAV